MPWKLQILAAVIGSPSASGQRLEKKQGAVSQSKVWISRRKTNQDESVTSLAMPLQQLMPNVTIVFDAATALAVINLARIEGVSVPWSARG
jgi:hypothetical protein